MNHSATSRLLRPLWKQSPRKQDVAQDSPVSTILDIYPTVQEIQDGNEDARPPPPLPDISSVVSRKIPESRKRAPLVRRFRDDYVMTRPVGTMIPMYTLSIHSMRLQMFRTAQCGIWECVHRRTGQVYCVKVLQDETEIHNLVAVQYHPHICRYHETIHEPVRSYMVMELYHGGNLLSHIVQNGPMEEAVAKTLIRQILQGVLHLHQTKRTIHGNISPDNILLENDRHVVLADFGGAVCISKYTAPERQSSCAADMYSVGAVLHSMVRGDAVELSDLRNLSRLCKQFLILLLHTDPDVRPTVQESLRHEFLASHNDEMVLLETPPRRIRKLWRLRGSSSAGSTASSCQS